MGMFDDIKKLLFGVKSVTKSAAEKTVEKGKAAGAKIADETEELWDKTKDVAEDVGEKIVDKTSEAWEKAVDSTEEIRGKIKEEAADLVEDVKDVAEDVKDVAEDVGSKIAEKAGSLYEKAKDMAEQVGEKIQEKSDELLDRDDDDDVKNTDVDSSNLEIDLDQETKIDDLFDDHVVPEQANDPGLDSEQVAAAIKKDPSSEGTSAKKTLVSEAKESIDKLSDKLDRTVEAAQQMADADEKTYESRETPSDALKRDAVADDDFFAKASAFADGDYRKVRDPYAPDTPEIVGRVESDDKIDEGTVPGFEDLDGDGNEIVDDALLLDEEE